jgi:hypothetical protein
VGDAIPSDKLPGGAGRRKEKVGQVPVVAPAAGD